jgi:hypothetical protein
MSGRISVHIRVLVLFWLLSSGIGLIFCFFLLFFDAAGVEEWVIVVSEHRVLAGERTGGVGRI